MIPFFGNKAHYDPLDYDSGNDDHNTAEAWVAAKVVLYPETAICCKGSDVSSILYSGVG